MRPKQADHSDATHPDPEIQDLLDHIFSLHRKDMDFRLHGSPYEALLHDLGDPHLRLPPVIHIAGTNGKGSTLATLRALLEGVGQSVHMLTSPHLLRFNERIVLNGFEMSDTVLKPLLKRVIAANAGKEITFFELTTAMAFLAMAEREADYCLIETGCGGRLDSTNIISNPVLTAISSIGYDHQKLLGDSLTEISGEKAGIMKPDTVCIIGHQPYAEEVHSVFMSKAEELDVKLTILGDNESASVPQLSLIGPHQRHNTALALAMYDALKRQNSDLPDPPVAALKNVHWPGRLQCLRRIEGQEIWFDGAHNTAGAKVLADQCAVWQSETPDMPTHFVLTLGAGKDAEAFLAPLLPYATNIYAADLSSGLAPRTAQSIINDVKSHKIQLFKPNMLSETKGRIIFCGSLYFYSKITEYLRV